MSPVQWWAIGAVVVAGAVVTATRAGEQPPTPPGIVIGRQELPPEPSHLIPGDYHTSGGTSELLDVAVIAADRTGRAVLTVLRNDGAGGLRPVPGAPEVRIGVRPVLAANGTFRSSAGSPLPTDLAIVDRPPDGVPVLRFLRGDGRGGFVVADRELILTELRDAPLTALVADRFRGEGQPVDLAIISGGRITVLFNDGRGNFAATRVTSDLPFDVRRAQVSTTLRPGKHVDLIVTHGRAQVSALLNVGDGHFRPSIEGPLAAGAADGLVVGDVTGDGADDIVTFDADLTLHVHRNRREAVVAFRALAPANPFDPAPRNVHRPGYVLVKGRGGTPRLATVVGGDGAPGPILHVLDGDGLGVFTVSGAGIPLGRPATGTRFSIRERTFFSTMPVTMEVEEVSAHRVERVLVGRFRSETTGGGAEDLALESHVITDMVEPRVCATDPRSPVRPPQKCPPPDPETLGKTCAAGECCFCARCGCAGECPSFARQPGCETTRTFSVLTTYDVARP